MGWKNWSYTKRSFLVSFIIVALSFLPFLEYVLRGGSMGVNQCAPIPNLGGGTTISCITMIFSLLLIPGLIIAMLFSGGGGITPMYWALAGFFSFVIYSLIGTLLGYIIGKIKSRKQTQINS